MTESMRRIGGSEAAAASRRAYQDLQSYLEAIIKPGADRQYSLVSVPGFYPGIRKSIVLPISPESIVGAIASIPHDTAYLEVHRHSGGIKGDVVGRILIATRDMRIGGDGMVEVFGGKIHNVALQDFVLDSSRLTGIIAIASGKEAKR